MRKLDRGRVDRVTSIRRNQASGARARGTSVRVVLVAALGAMFAGCVERTIELPAHARLSVEEVCEAYCDMQLTCPKMHQFSSACYDTCVDPRLVWPEISDECADATFLWYSCYVDLGCEGLPEPPAPGEEPVHVCTLDEVAPDYEYSAEDCGYSSVLEDGGG